MGLTKHADGPTVVQVMISAREAAFALEIHAGLSRERARRVLGCGLAGHPERLVSRLLYDGARVHALANRPLVTEADIDDACPDGVLWVRRTIDVTEPVARQREVVARDWDFSAPTRVALLVRIARAGGRFPVVATVSGFVTHGADLTDVVVRGTEDGYVYDLQLEDPGPWFDRLRDRRVPSAPGRAWSIRGWQPYARRRLPR